jgi:hypothetical protein
MSTHRKKIESFCSSRNIGRLWARDVRVPRSWRGRWTRTEGHIRGCLRGSGRVRHDAEKSLETIELGTKLVCILLAARHAANMKSADARNALVDKKNARLRKSDCVFPGAEMSLVSVAASTARIAAFEQLQNSPHRKQHPRLTDRTGNSTVMSVCKQGKTKTRPLLVFCREEERKGKWSKCYAASQSIVTKHTSFDLHSARRASDKSKERLGSKKPTLSTSHWFAVPLLLRGLVAVVEHRLVLCQRVPVRRRVLSRVRVETHV